MNMLRGMLMLLLSVVLGLATVSFVFALMVAAVKVLRLILALP